MRREKNFKIIRREEIPNTDVPNEEGRGFQNTDGVGGGIPNVAGGEIPEEEGGMTNVNRGRAFPNVDVGGIPNEEGGDMPNADGAEGTRKNTWGL